MVKKRLALLAIALVFGLAVALWELRAPRPNVLLITVESLRPDFLSCYGGAHRKTPNIDAFAAEGTLFTEALADIPWPLGSMTSVMTGQYAPHHRVHSLYQRFSGSLPTLAETFHAAGYQTGAIVGTFDFDPIFQLNGGFETYDARFDSAQIIQSKHPLHVASIFYGRPLEDRLLRRRKVRSDSWRTDARVTDAAIGWLQRRRAAPFLLWVDYFGTYQRWGPGAEEFEMALLYQPNVLVIDEQIGRLLRTLKDFHLDDSTIIVLHADHGVRMLQHQDRGAGEGLYEPDLHVPLLMRWPGRIPAGRRVAGLTRLIDLFPTVAGLAGINLPAPVDGRSLVPAITGAGRVTIPDAYSETYLSATLETAREAKDSEGKTVAFGLARHAIRTAQWKLMRDEPVPLIEHPETTVPAEVRQAYTSEELYNLTDDPGELRNVIGANPAVAAGLRARLAAYLPEQK